MKRFAKSVLASIVSFGLLLCSIPLTFAADDTFVEGNIHYQITGPSAVAVISDTETAGQHSTYTGQIDIPETVTHGSTTYNVTKIDGLAFERSTVTKVTVPKTVTEIGLQAFFQCETVTEIVLTDGLTTIGSSAFDGCVALETLTIPSTVTNIGESAFHGCTALTSITIPSGVTDGLVEVLKGTFGESPQYGGQVTIADGSPYRIQDGVLYKGTVLECVVDNTISKIEVPDGVSEIREWAFGYEQSSDSTLTSITLPDSVKKIGDYAFQNAHITTIDLSHVESIGELAFGYCAELADVTWPVDLKNLGQQAFNGCAALTAVEISGSVTEIPEMAFTGCVALTSIKLSEGIASIGDYTFDLTNDDLVNPNPQLNVFLVPSTVTSLGKIFLGGVKADGGTALIFKGTTLPTFAAAQGDEDGALDGIRADNEMNTPTIYYPAEAKADYENSTELKDMLPKDESGAFTGAYGLTLRSDFVKVMAANAEPSESNTLTFTADVPTGATLSVKSGNPDIATAAVGADGKTITVTSVAEGETDITAKITLDNETGFVLLEQKATVTVLAADKEPAVVVPAAPETKNPVAESTAKTEGEKTLATNIAETLKPAGGSSGLTVAPETLTEAAAAIAASNTVSAEDGKKALAEKNVQVADDAEVSIVVQPYLDIAIQDVTIAGEGDSQTTTLTLDITPMYQRVATTADLKKETPDDIIVKKDGVNDANAVVMDSGKLEITKPVEVVIPLPAGVINSETAYITHVTGSGRSYVYDGAIKDNVLRFTNPHGFSTFTMSAANPTVAQIDGTKYASLQDALDEAATGKTIDLRKDGLTGKITETKTITLRNATDANLTVTINDTAYTLAAGATQEVVYPRPTDGGNTGGGGGGSVTTYAVSVNSVQNGTVSVSPKSAGKGSTVTITTKPDTGYQLEKLTVTDSKGETIKLTDKGDGKYTFAMPSSKVTVSASFVKTAEQPSGGFIDVSTGAYYYDAVQWAVDKGITMGTSATLFSPDLSCTRAQAVTFLWRAKGSPAPKGTANPFTDVASGSYYYDAVQWAVEQGITSGTSADTFSPDATVSRGQIVTLLYRAAGSPAVSGSSAFTDVAADAYYAAAVQWAVETGVTLGVSDTAFSPKADCTRGHIVTFLCRSMAD